MQNLSTEKNENEPDKRALLILNTTSNNNYYSKSPESTTMSGSRFQNIPSLVVNDEEINIESFDDSTTNATTNSYYVPVSQQRIQVVIIDDDANEVNQTDDYYDNYSYEASNNNAATGPSDDANNAVDDERANNEGDQKKESDELLDRVTSNEHAASSINHVESAKRVRSKNKLNCFKSSSSRNKRPSIEFARRRSLASTNENGDLMTGHSKDPASNNVNRLMRNFRKYVRNNCLW